MQRLLLLATVLLLGINIAYAQTPQPYAGLQTRAIKSLSDQQIADLRAGRGMSFALAAELNGYPGPRHVLDLARRLAISAEQRSRVQELYERMKAEAVPLGEKLLTQEAELNGQFSNRTITPASLDQLAREIGETQAVLRATHLKYHLRTVEILTPEQIGRYSKLRGYTGGGGGHQMQHRGVH